MNSTRVAAAAALGLDGLDLIVRNLHLIERERDMRVRERDESPRSKYDFSLSS
jgi:hypothetical protein